MKGTYSISQAARMVGLGIDAVRFYEKKGLVHPKVDPQNRYRKYSLYELMELLDVSYYRSLGMSIEQIQKLYQSSDEEQLIQLLQEKHQETQRRIRYEQQLLKRIEHVNSMVQRIRERDGEIGRATFPASYVLFEEQENSLERYLEQVSGMDYDHYVFCQLVREFSIAPTGEVGQPQRTVLLLDQQVAQELGEQAENRKSMPATPALYSVVRLPDAEAEQVDLKPMLAYARQENLHLQDRVLMVEVPLISYTDLDHYYAELFIPLAE